MLVSRRSCKDLYNLYPPLEFQIGPTLLVINSKGYLYNLPGQTDCFVGVSSIPDSANHYRLGTIFMRNFYVGLDFDQNLVVFGLTQDKDTAEIHGKA